MSQKTIENFRLFSAFGTFIAKPRKISKIICENEKKA